MVFEICHLDNSRILLLICEQRVWTIDCRGSFIPGCRLSSMHHEHLVSDHSRFKDIPPTIEMYFCKLHQKQHIKPDRKEGGRENNKPLCLVFLPGGDVVSVRVGEARQHHCALLLPRCSHRLSKPPGGENVDPGFHLPAIVVNSPGAAAIRSWPIRRT